MTIGGEHYILPSHLFKKSKGYLDDLVQSLKYNYSVNYTFGGYFSLLAILDEIKPMFDDHSVVLLPSYLCSSILKPFILKGIQYRFYKVDENLFIDSEYLVSIINDNVKAVLFIDYFGASQMERIQTILCSLKSKKIVVIQDVVQCLKIKKELLYGDYIFNSFRKFFPFEGSILLSKEEMNINYSNKKNRYIKYKRFGQFLRYIHIKFNVLPSRIFLYIFRKAEERYYSNEILRMPKFNFRQLNKYEIDFIVASQRYYFDQLFNTFFDKVPGLLRNKNYVPLGFVIKIHERETIRMHLFEKSIFPPIHWKLSNEIGENIFEKSIQLSSKIMTIPLIGITEKKYEYLFENLNKIIKNEYIS